LKIIHRDLKPENIFVSPDGHLKVADFGLARMLDLGDGPGEVVGTHGYIPPETITWGPATRAIDIWSLGIILLELHMG
ncbi:kinase-like protein, partial [Panus rudis PR-1116 ss-1]